MPSHLLKNSSTSPISETSRKAAVTLFRLRAPLRLDFLLNLVTSHPCVVNLSKATGKFGERTAQPGAFLLLTPSSICAHILSIAASGLRKIRLTTEYFRLYRSSM